MSSFLILGAGGYAKMVAETVLEEDPASRIAFLDDQSIQPVLGWPVLGSLSCALDPSIKDQFPLALVAICHPGTRLRWLFKLQAAGYLLPRLKHPTAWISPSAQIAPGTVVLAHVTVQAKSVIGCGTILNTACSVDHDAQLSDGVHIGSGARIAGEVMVGTRSCIGIGASVIQQVRIGSDVTVAAGAAVVRDLPDGVTATGVPAQILSPI